ncbi:unnamed protein product [Hymenolepis diminuta]|uniref:Deacetylase sirtuin-type domain-containing protein n=1 Tax=Hymenolepis diminuta TaxID=6216 RepID=A0A0R3SFH6_HYMDI|nr:unnamed protein product [Hymenolepis diminuta]
MVVLGGNSNKILQNEMRLKGHVFSVSNGELVLTKQSGVTEKVVLSIFNFQRYRSSYKCIKSILNLMKMRSKIMVLTGAGISVSCGIPDFRSSGGIYARLKREYPQLSCPEDMFDFDVFKSDPRPFYSFAKDIFPGQFRPSLTHQFIRSLERKSKLLQNYTQNIDTLEQVAGISKVCYCHGSFATASCMDCRRSFSGEDIRKAVMSQHIPYCPHCNPEIGLKGISAKSNIHLPSTGVVKPDIVFFKENLPSHFTDCIEMDRNETDLLLVIGTSLQVYPVASIPRYLPVNIPKVLINREPIDDLKFDFELIGDCDVIVRHLCSELNWNLGGEESDDKVFPDSIYLIYALTGR